MTDKIDPTIDIITVVKNGVSEIKINIENIMRLQKLNEGISWIVIDGMSEDGTTDLIKKSNINKLTHVLSEDGGIYEAMNLGLSKVTSDFFVFLNAGDILLESHPRLSEGKINCFKSLWHDHRGNTIPKFDIYAPMIGKLMSHQGMFFSKEFRNLEYQTNLSISADMELKYRVLKKGVCERLDVFAVSSLTGGVSQVYLSPTNYFDRLRQIFIAQRNHTEILTRWLTIIFYAITLTRKVRFRQARK